MGVGEWDGGELMRCEWGRQSICPSETTSTTESRSSNQLPHHTKPTHRGKHTYDTQRACPCTSLKGSSERETYNAHKSQSGRSLELLMRCFLLHPEPEGTAIRSPPKISRRAALDMGGAFVVLFLCVFTSMQCGCRHAVWVGVARSDGAAFSKDEGRIGG